MLVGGFADRWLEVLDEPGLAWFEALLAEQDVDILAWAFGTADVPPAFHGPMLDRLRALDYIVLDGH